MCFVFDVHWPRRSSGFRIAQDFVSLNIFDVSACLMLYVVCGVSGGGGLLSAGCEIGTLVFGLRDMTYRFGPISFSGILFL